MSALILAACADRDASADFAAVAVPETPMTAPALTDTDALIGDWTIDGRGACRVSLSATERARVAGAMGVEMMTAEVVGCAGLDRVRGWRPIPFGLELTDEGGMAVATFEGGGASGYRSTDGRFTLRRP